MKRKSVGSDAGVSPAAMRACMKKLNVFETDARDAAECIETSIATMERCAVASVNVHLDGATTALGALAYQSTRAKETARRIARAQSKVCADAEEHAVTNVEQLLALCGALRTQRVLTCVSVDALAFADISAPLSITALADDVPLTFGCILTQPVSVDNSTISVPPYGKLRPALQNVICVTLRDAWNEPLSVDVGDFVLVLSVAGKDERVKLHASTLDVNQYELAFSLKVGTHMDVETRAVLLVQDVELHAWSFWTFDDGPVLVKCAREDVPARTAPYCALDDEPELDFDRTSLLALASIEVPIADAAHALQRMRTMVQLYGFATMTLQANVQAFLPHGTVARCNVLDPAGQELGFAIHALVHRGHGTVVFFVKGYGLAQRFVPVLQRAALLPDIMEAYAVCPAAVLLCAVPTWHTVQQRSKPFPDRFVTELLACLSQSSYVLEHLLYVSKTPVEAANLREMPLHAREQLAAALRGLRTGPFVSPSYQRHTYQCLYRLGLVTEDDASYVPAFEMMLLRFAVHV